jgi:hypothetical protein
MSIKRISNTGLTGLKYTVFNAGNTPIPDVPDAPTIGTATAGAGSATVTYTAAATGGAATTFTATSSPGSLTGTGTSPITVSSLSNGTAYTFTVVASNSTGSSPASSASNSVTPFVADTGAMFPIGMVQVGSAGTSSISFSNIPNTYKHLQIRFIYETGDWGTFRFNGDTTSSNYRSHTLTGNGSTASSGTAANIIYEPQSSNGGNRNTYAGIIDILDYSSTSKYKTTRSLEGTDINGSGYIILNSGLWMSTAAVTSISMTRNTTDWGNYSQFALYGIKG